MRRHDWPPVILVMLSLMIAAGASRTARADVLCEDPVPTTAGAVRGIADRQTATCSWRGVPYAAPPVGDRRWRRPEPPLAWEGVRPASRFAPRCMQRGVMELINEDPSKKMSEDCLHLNIWRPRAGGPHPVMVWFHGGALYGGTGNSPIYHGGRLAEGGDVVVVTVNYRLNIFGFMASEALAAEDPDGSTGNYGLLDQIQALRWVQENIAAFGGDPGRVTIFGESAGGWSVCNLMATPLAKGLFHGAILESGGCHAVTDLARGFEVGRRVEKDMGCAAGDLECLRAAPSIKLVRRGMRSEQHGFEWIPRVDGYVLSGRPIDIIASGHYNNVPFIAGANRNEADSAVAGVPYYYFGTRKAYPGRLADAFGPDAAERLAALYRIEELGSPRGCYRRILTESALLCPTLNGLSAAADQQASSWLYRFDYHDFWWGGILGALHGAEIPFVFGTHDRPPFSWIYRKGARARAKPLTQTVMGYWSRFAHTGDPNGPGLPVWRPFRMEGLVQVLDAKVRSEQISPALVARCAFWDEHAKAHPWIVETFGLFDRRPGRTRVVPEAVPLRRPSSAIAAQPTATTGESAPNAPAGTTVAQPAPAPRAVDGAIAAPPTAIAAQPGSDVPGPKAGDSPADSHPAPIQQ